ncbi:hypothetical protein BZG36_04879 [Bifiguratus adelaidae]|uniref:Uncharacterized protein n=1 Tax=Bifiguratus adelaidae TaxID=1938954 RepID=A0A261XVL3_9FUNG|nr:hypothetical protein BZG36_04879 [Bifiguratus adelaidae]
MDYHYPRGAGFRHCSHHYHTGKRFGLFGLLVAGFIGYTAGKHNWENKLPRRIIIEEAPNEHSNALKEWHNDTVELLLAQTTIAASRQYRSSLLLAAFNAGNSQGLQLLLNHGVDVCAAYNEEQQIFDAALKDIGEPWWRPMSRGRDERGRMDCLRVFLEGGMKLDLKSMLGHTLLVEAAHCDRSDIVSLLMEYGADIEVRNDKDDTPLLTVMYKYSQLLGATDRDVVAANILLDHGASLSAHGHEGNTALHRCIEMSLDGYAAGEAIRRNHGHLPLSIETFDNFPYLVTLIRKGADINAQNDNGMTPLHTAASGMDIDSYCNGYELWLLLDQGCIVDKADRNGRTSLHYAAEHSNVESMNSAKISLEYGANPNARDKDGLTPLRVAAQTWTEDPNFIFTLLDHVDTDINAQDNSGLTPLHHAVLNLKNFMFPALINKGANWNIKSHDGRTPMEMVPSSIVEPVAPPRTHSSPQSTPTEMVPLNHHGQPRRLELEEYREYLSLWEQYHATVLRMNMAPTRNAIIARAMARHGVGFIQMKEWIIRGYVEQMEQHFNNIED